MGINEMQHWNIPPPLQFYKMRMQLMYMHFYNNQEQQ